jgi:hypothetical protein
MNDRIVSLERDEINFDVASSLNEITMESEVRDYSQQFVDTGTHSVPSFGVPL